MDPRIEKMADVLVNYSIGVRPGNWIVISTSVLGQPLANACLRAVLRAGGNATIFLGSEEAEEILLREASDDQLGFVSPILPVVYDLADASMSLLAPANTRAKTNVDPQKMAIQSKSREQIVEKFMKRAAEGSLHWTVAQCPTNAAAQDAGMSLREYEDFVFTAGLLDEADPVAAWTQLGERQQRLVDWLEGKKSIHIRAPGTDLTLSVADRTWVNDRGKENFPGGEIFTGPVEESAEGVIELTFPAFYGGREVSGVRLVFEAGKVVSASARSDEEFLLHMLDLDDGACRLGELAFGTNPGIQRFTKNTLFDEKIGGTLHLALGRSYPETGGKNVSALHWDMVCDLRKDAAVTVDNQLFSRNGEFVI